ILLLYMHSNFFMDSDLINIYLKSKPMRLSSFFFMTARTRFFKFAYIYNRFYFYHTGFQISYLKGNLKIALWLVFELFFSPSNAHLELRYFAILRNLDHDEVFSVRDNTYDFFYFEIFRKILKYFKGNFIFRFFYLFFIFRDFVLKLFVWKNFFPLNFIQDFIYFLRLHYFWILLRELNIFRSLN